VKLRTGIGLFLAVILISSSIFAESFELSADQKENVENILKKMTLEDEIGQLVQVSKDKLDTEKLSTGKIGAALNVSGAENVNRLQRLALEGGAKVPLLLGLDVIHGYVTIFPIPLAEACSFDLGLAERTAEAAAMEASADGIRWTFAPMVDIARDPRWGRVMEGAGEDPLLGASFAAARVRGFQRRHRLVACLKHFVGYGAVEAGREYNAVDLNPRKLWEVYYPPFEGGLDAGAGTVMSSFNTLNGVPLAADPESLRGVLKDRFGFPGLVVSDWASIHELIRHGVAADSADAARQGMDAGVDMDMCGGDYEASLAVLVRDGKIPRYEIDDAVRRILTVKAWLGLLDDPWVKEDAAAKVTLSAAHRALALEAAQKSCVLLKNDGTLPLKSGVHRIAVIGPLADNGADLLGNWSAHGDPKDVVTLAAGLRNRLGAGTEVSVAKGCSTTGEDRSGFAEALSRAAEAEVVVVAMGEARSMYGEAYSRTELELPGVQRELLEKILVLGKPTVLVLFGGRPLALQWEQDMVPAIVEAWAPGVEGGNAVADVLLGRVEPQGRLAMTFPRKVGQIPIYYAALPTGRPAGPEKWTSKYIDCPVTPLYPFGYGLGYTTFAYSAVTVTTSADLSAAVTVTVRVTNTGSRPGTETVQLYVHGRVASVSRPVKELKAFRQVTLKPGESRSLRFLLEPDAFGYYDREGRFGIQAGMYDVFVGGDSSTENAATVTLQGEAGFHLLAHTRPHLEQEQRVAAEPFVVEGGGVARTAADAATGPTGPEAAAAQP
jgi:beta-glucosidase